MAGVAHVRLVLSIGGYASGVNMRYFRRGAMHLLLMVMAALSLPANFATLRVAG